MFLWLSNDKKNILINLLIVPLATFLKSNISLILEWICELHLHTIFFLFVDCMLPESKHPVWLSFLSYVILTHIKHSGYVRWMIKWRLLISCTPKKYVAPLVLWFLVLTLLKKTVHPTQLYMQGWKNNTRFSFIVTPNVIWI